MYSASAAGASERFQHAFCLNSLKLSTYTVCDDEVHANVVTTRADEPLLNFAAEIRELWLFNIHRHRERTLNSKETIFSLKITQNFFTNVT